MDRPTRRFGSVQLNHSDKHWVQSVLAKYFRTLNGSGAVFGSKFGRFPHKRLAKLGFLRKINYYEIINQGLISVQKRVCTSSRANSSQYCFKTFFRNFSTFERSVRVGGQQTVQQTNSEKVGSASFGNVDFLTNYGP